MITGNKVRKIERYLPIDRRGDGCGFIGPENGEEFVGIPYQWSSENSMPFIEVRKDGFVIKTINAIDVAEIEYET